MARTLKPYSLQFILLSSFTFASTISMGGNWGVLGSSAFIIRELDPVLFKGDYFEKISGSHGRSFGLSRGTPLTRYSYLEIGIGLVQVSFLKETQGIFPETNTYGFIYANSKSDYLCVPIAVQHYIANRNWYRYGFRIAYKPSLEIAGTTSLLAFGGADSSAYFANYSNEIQGFRHSLQFAFSHELILYKYSTIEIAPWFELGSAYYKSSGKAPGSICFGVDINFRIKLPRIQIEWVKDPRSNAQKDLLKKKQKEIEEQLKNKPK